MDLLMHLPFFSPSLTKCSETCSTIVIAYIDDIPMHLTTLKEHVKHVCSVLSHFLEHNLYVKLEKCEFHRKSITFLGYVLSQEGVEMDQSKIAAVTTITKHQRTTMLSSSTEDSSTITAP